MEDTASEVKVSVCVVTYNQENYIRQCLQSLVDQETDFKFEIIVGEDCSTDSTRSIIQEFVDKYPNLVKPLFNHKNLGAIENIKQVYKEAKGKYIAHLDGDDMALPNKLQIQFNVMEQNPNCSICGHDVEEIDKRGDLINISKKDIKDTLNRYEFIVLGKNFCHSSKFFLNNFTLEEYDNLLSLPDMIDYEIHLESLRKGKYIHINLPLGRYRLLTGISSENNKVSKILLNSPDRIYSKLLLEYKKPHEKRAIRKKYALEVLRLSHQIAIIEENENEFKKLVSKSININKITKEQLIYLMGTISPKIFFKILKVRHKLKNFNVL